MQGLAGDKSPRGNGCTTEVTKIPSMKAAIAEMFTRRIWSERRGISLHPYLPILFDARRRALQDCRSKAPWRTTVEGRLRKITRPSDLDMHSRTHTARPSFFGMFGPARTGTPGRMPCLQIDDDGIILARPSFHLGPLVPPSDRLVLRFMFRIVLPKDMWVHRAMPSPLLFRRDKWRFHVVISRLVTPRITPALRSAPARFRRTRSLPWVLLARDINLAPDSPLGDGKWHSMEIVLDRTTKQLKVWTDGLLKQGKVQKSKWAHLRPNDHAVRLSFQASPGVVPSKKGGLQCPILFADVALNLDRAPAKEDGSGSGVREEHSESRGSEKVR